MASVLAMTSSPELQESPCGWCWARSRRAGDYPQGWCSGPSVAPVCAHQSVGEDEIGSILRLTSDGEGVIGYLRQQRRLRHERAEACKQHDPHVLPPTWISCDVSPHDACCRIIADVVALFLHRLQRLTRGSHRAATS
eukprot:462917-Amphidinium_carterae.1